VVHSLFTSSKASFRSPAQTRASGPTWVGVDLRLVAGLWFGNLRVPRRALLACPDEGVWAYVGWGRSGVRGWAVTAAIQTQRGKLVPEWNLRWIICQDFCPV